MKSFSKTYSKATAIFFAILFVWNSLLSYLMFYVERQLVRSNIEQLVRSGHFDRSYLVVIDHNNNGEFILECENEISIEGKMYDVVSKEYDDRGNLKFYCLSDEDESFLIERYNSNAQNENKSAKNILKLICFSPFVHQNNSGHMKSFSMTENLFSFYNLSFTSIDRDVVLRPPDEHYPSFLL